MTTLDLIKNKSINRIKNLCHNWIIDNCYSPNDIRKYKFLISECLNIDEIKIISKSIYKEYNQSYISNDDGTLYFFLKVNKYI